MTLWLEIQNCKCHFSPLQKFKLHHYILSEWFFLIYIIHKNNATVLYHNVMFRQRKQSTCSCSRITKAVFTKSPPSHCIWHDYSQNQSYWRQWLPNICKINTTVYTTYYNRCKINQATKCKSIPVILICDGYNYNLQILLYMPTAFWKFWFSKNPVSFTMHIKWETVKMWTWQHLKREIKSFYSRHTVSVSYWLVSHCSFALYTTFVFESCFETDSKLRIFIEHQR